MATLLSVPIVFHDPIYSAQKIWPYYSARFPEPQDISDWDCMSCILNGGYWPSPSSRPERMLKMQEIKRDIRLIKNYLEEDKQLSGAAELAVIKAGVQMIEQGLESNPNLTTVRNLSIATGKLTETVTMRFMQAFLGPLDFASTTATLA